MGKKYSNVPYNIELTLDKNNIYLRYKCTDYPKVVLSRNSTPADVKKAFGDLERRAKNERKAQFRSDRRKTLVKEV